MSDFDPARSPSPAELRHWVDGHGFNVTVACKVLSVSRGTYSKAIKGKGKIKIGHWARALVLTKDCDIEPALRAILGNWLYGRTLGSDKTRRVPSITSQAVSPAEVDRFMRPYKSMAYGQGPSRSVLVKRLMSRFGVSRATAYRCYTNWVEARKARK